MAGAAIKARETGRRYLMRKTASVTITLPWDMMIKIDEIATEEHISFSKSVQNKIQQGYAYSRLVEVQLKKEVEIKEEVTI